MKIATFRTLAAISLIFLTSSAASAAECLQYEPTMVTIHGRVSLKPAYGAPGFGEDPKHDAREDYLALTLDTPICMAATAKPQTADVAETGITTMQLVFDNAEAFRKAKRWVGKQVSVTGSLYHCFTGHHHTTVLLTLKDIGPAR